MNSLGGQPASTVRGQRIKPTHSFSSASMTLWRAESLECYVGYHAH